MAWYESFKNACERHRWNPPKLAKATRISEQTIRNWVRTKVDRGQPSISDAIKIAEATNLSLEELFRGRRSDDRIEAILRRAIAEVQEVTQADPLAASSGNR